MLLSCADKNECAEDVELCRAGFCRNVPGSWECECREGWQLTPDLRDCVDTRTGACFDQYRGGGILSCLIRRYRVSQKKVGSQKQWP